ncbi:MAG TPA: SEC-C metal-binding domain-containing protein [Povalibacter sp.]|uniref:YecA family protein n=1 Tax=Povalibacter sp. TaxID=1962978 RepID=UPI002CE87CCD|nr:SEC-C metal-binding domain-containing protein [Povalibacter sp.]HMN44165.1 SEC-C metal-binding domain-containing protein [Povalibacter sp.]
MIISTPGSDELPRYESSELAVLSEQQLIELMIRDEDRVPRNVIDECVRRGDAMLEKLQLVVGPDAEWKFAEHAIAGRWWLVLHAAFILGLMEDDAAGRLLLALMRRLAGDEDPDLEDWLEGAWPDLFGNKSDAVLHDVEVFAFSAGAMPYMRPHAVDLVLAASECRGPGALDDALGKVAAWVGDESHDLQDRLLTAAVLLNFPRAAHRALLNDLADTPDGALVFTREEVDEVYEAAEDAPRWLGIDDAWSFYDPAEIAARRQRWRDEASFRKDYHDAEYELVTYVRESPKVGRNDPCPCGSGRKYKKCCLEKESRD